MTAPAAIGPGRRALVVTGIGVSLPEGDTPRAVLAAAVPPVEEPWFDVRTELGPRGYKYLPPACHYLLAAARRAALDAGGLDRVPAERRAAAVGTNSALTAMFADMDRTVTGGHADDLSPALAPFFAINVLGSRLSAEQDLKAFNLTLTSPRVAGLEAVETGGRALVAGRCSLLVAAAMEHAGPGQPTTGPGQPAGAPDGVPAERGAVAFVLEPPSAAAEGGTGGYGSVRVRTVFAPPRLLGTADGRRRMAVLVEDMMTELGVAGPLPVPVYPVLDSSPVSEAVAMALPAAHGGTHQMYPAVPAGAGCLTPVRLIAGLLATGAGDALVVTATAEGNIALARLYAPDQARSGRPGTGTGAGAGAGAGTGGSAPC